MSLLVQLIAWRDSWAPALSSWCIWHVGTTQDLENTIYSPPVKYGIQRNYRFLTCSLTNRRLWLFGLIARSSHRKDHRRALAAAIQVPPDWKRPKGRPSHTWLRAIEADLGLLNIDLATAWRKATIRDDWKKKKKQKKKDSSAAWSLWWVGRSSLMTHSRGFLGDFRGQTQLRVENGLKWSYVVLELEC